MVKVEAFLLSHRAQNNLEYFIKVLGYKQLLGFMKNDIAYTGISKMLSFLFFFSPEMIKIYFSA